MRIYNSKVEETLLSEIQYALNYDIEIRHVRAGGSVNLR